MAAHPSILAWRIPRRGARQATVHGGTRVGHDLTTKLTPPIISWGVSKHLNCLEHKSVTSLKWCLL